MKKLILLRFCTDLQRRCLPGCACIYMVPPKLTMLNEAEETSPSAGKFSPGEPTDLRVSPGGVSSPGIPQDHALRSWLSNSHCTAKRARTALTTAQRKGYLHRSVANWKHKWSLGGKNTQFLYKILITQPSPGTRFVCLALQGIKLFPYIYV